MRRGEARLGPRQPAARAQALFERRWRLAELLHAAQTGRTLSALVEALGASRATVYRDLAFLQGVGLPITNELVNGEARYRSLGAARPGLVSPLRRVALDLACEALSSLRGTRLWSEINGLRRDLPTMRVGAAVTVSTAAAHNVDAAILEPVERATREARTLELGYRGARDDVVRARKVAPLELWLVKGHLYVAGHDLDVGAARTFKVVRIVSARLGEPFERSAYPQPERAGSVVVWQGAPMCVAVRLASQVSRFAAEYPLVAGQVVELEASGAAVVRATVAGSEEVLRWVLGWGAAAEVLGPPALRARVAEELGRALAAYGEGEERGVSREVRHPAVRLARTSANQRQDSDHSDAGEDVDDR